MLSHPHQVCISPHQEHGLILHSIQTAASHSQRGQQAQGVTEHDLHFAPEPELDQIPKSRRLFCLSIIRAQTGLESSSQADRSPVSREKSKICPCAFPDRREPQCDLHPLGRRDRGAFSSSPWLQKVVAGSHAAL